MSSSQSNREPSLLHLHGSGEFSRRVSDCLNRAGLRAEDCDDPFSAMGSLAARRANRVCAVLVDYSSLSDTDREFPRLAMSLTANAAVILYGEPALLEADAEMMQCGARVVTTSEQLDAAIGEIEQRLGVARQLDEQPSTDPDARTGDSPAENLRVTIAAVDTNSDDPDDATDAPPDAPPDALTEAASQKWDQPVLDLIDSDSDAIARILPDLDTDDEQLVDEEDEESGEVPTPWSPSSQRPLRSPPTTPDETPPAEEDAKRSAVGESTEPVLTREELDALLGEKQRPA